MRTIAKIVHTAAVILTRPAEPVSDEQVKDNIVPIAL